MNQIGTSYQTNSGTVQFVHGNSSGVGGVFMPSLNLSTGEFITSISGMEDWYINQLTLSTNRGQSVQWPLSANSANSFNWTVPDGATLIGFQGSSGDYLNTLQAVYIQFQPATWWSSASIPQYVPAGSYQQTGSDVTIEIQAQCCSESGAKLSSSLKYTSSQAFTIGDISNDDGVLTLVIGDGNVQNVNTGLGVFIPAGSYQGSSSVVTVTLTANCLNSQNQSVPSSLTYSSSEAASFSNIVNNNGVLTSVSST
jgi:hypothetical protein